ncbi:hypothetical protein [Methylobacterium sp. WL120]|jgi:hypothetical protein|uniref:hypothetical protein n=1 Tax=Methylobacterium sp. WL120 TaxID=2603887 RepID=UPI0011C9338E|nr:hypothetical protein [Methylobacterium sp. WL120]TXM70702.1 hypothetical protein FV229_01690 [Methylobacterium sp. WL120]
MDVVLTPTGQTGKSWTLKDRLGRSLGSIGETETGDDFRILPEAWGVLKNVKRGHASLDAAMSAIAGATNGACTLDSGDWE